MEDLKKNNGSETDYLQNHIVRENQKSYYTMNDIKIELKAPGAFDTHLKNI